MSEQLFEVVFRGDVEPGQSVVTVKEGLAKLFNAEASRIDQMFSGKPVVIKANLDEETARHYQSSLKKVGALADIRPVKSVSPVKDSNNEMPDSTSNDQDSSSTILNKTTSNNSAPNNEAINQASDTSNAESQADQEPDGLENFDFDFDVAPVGSDVLPTEHKKDFTPAEVDTSHLTISEVGADVLEQKDKRSYEDRDVDTSHLSVDDLESNSDD